MSVKLILRKLDIFISLKQFAMTKSQRKQPTHHSFILQLFTEVLGVRPCPGCGTRRCALLLGCNSFFPGCRARILNRRCMDFTGRICVYVLPVKSIPGAHQILKGQGLAPWIIVSLCGFQEHLSTCRKILKFSTVSLGNYVRFLSSKLLCISLQLSDGEGIGSIGKV